ncbi:hypothetical protein DPMN_079415 [Dreissena polymorpha]|uniref:Uncharacterized protein n=1 Tax=Dreissena polymorpha TaxID=45954 RepID=A0A9D4BQ17_DREPO|nr:hypothetical protein DPMN_079415 [Dreissena polymorpha]
MSVRFRKNDEINRGIRDVASKNQPLYAIKLNFLEATLDDETVLHVFQNCSKLQWVEIMGCASLSNNTLGTITNGERSRVMKISKCRFVTPTCIGKALDRCSRLRALHVEGIGAIQHILDKHSCQLFDCLTTLSLAHCFNLSDECLGQIAKRCPFLRSINLTCCCRITNVGFIQLVNHCPSISELSSKTVQSTRSV